MIFCDETRIRGWIDIQDNKRDALVAHAGEQFDLANLPPSWLTQVGQASDTTSSITDFPANDPILKFPFPWRSVRGTSFQDRLSSVSDTGGG